jgi:hypothetical protein
MTSTFIFTAFNLFYLNRRLVHSNSRLCRRCAIRYSDTGTSSLRSPYERSRVEMPGVIRCRRSPTGVYARNDALAGVMNCCRQLGCASPSFPAMPIKRERAK